MKTPTFLLIAVALLATGPAVRAGDATTATVKFSDSTKPGVLNIYISQGDLRIRGLDTDTISVTSEAEIQSPSAKRKDGLRVLTSSASFTLTEKDNIASLDYGRDAMPTGGSSDFVVSVPKKTALKIANGWGGDIRVEYVDGDVEIKTMNSEVRLNQLGGATLVETMNGEVDATYATLPEGKALSFTSMNGEITLRVPVAARANVRFRSQNGSILTDFDDSELATKTESLPDGGYGRTGEAARKAAQVARAVADKAREVAEDVRAAVEEEMAAHREAEAEKTAPDASPRAPRAPRPPRAPVAPAIPSFSGGKVVTGTLNGGGTEIHAATMNGDITLRKAGTKAADQTVEK